MLASGATNSEIYIWDLNNPATPMTPGSLSQPADEVTCLAWNRKVPHILASTFASRCVVWDLKKNEPIIKVSGAETRFQAQSWSSAYLLSSSTNENKSMKPTSSKPC